MALIRVGAVKALRPGAWVLLLLGLGCASGAAPPPSATPSASPTAGGEHHHAAHTGDAPDLLGAEMLAYERARPIFERYCARCHTTKGGRATEEALKHFNMDRYPFGGHHQTEITQTVRKVLGSTGKKVTMPRNDPGAVQGEDLMLILDWAESFDTARVVGLHVAEPDHDGHAH